MVTPPRVECTVRYRGGGIVARSNMRKRLAIVGKLFLFKEYTPATATDETRAVLDSYSIFTRWIS